MLFAASAEQISKQKNEMISIKITGLLDMRVLKKWNESVVLRDDFWSQNSHNNSLDYPSIVEGLRKISKTVSE